MWICSGIALEQVAQAVSTQDSLKARAAAGLGEVALLAQRQTGGRGRLGREWRSIQGNLHLSVLLRPGPLRRPGHWSIVAAVALAHSVQPYAHGRELRLKWPNDVLLDGGKLGGILLDAGGPPPWLVIGFGVNLAAAPEGLGRKLAALNGAVSPEAFAPRLLEALQSWRTRYQHEGFGPVREAWLALGHAPGETLAADWGGRRVEGRFSGLAEDGALILDGADGPFMISAGELA